MFRDAIGASLMGAGTSFYAGFVIFSVVGFIAFKTGLPIDDLVASGIKTIGYQCALNKCFEQLSLSVVKCVRCSHTVSCSIRYYDSPMSLNPISVEFKLISETTLKVQKCDFIGRCSLGIGRHPWLLA